MIYIYIYIGTGVRWNFALAEPANPNELRVHHLSQQHWLVQLPRLQAVGALQVCLTSWSTISTPLRQPCVMLQ